MLFLIAARRSEIGECGLRTAEMKLHQSASCVIHLYQQRVGRATFLKPVVIAAVDLYQLSNAGMAVARLLNFRGAIMRDTYTVSQSVG